MIVFLSLCYCGVIWLLVARLKLLPWNRTTQIGAVTVGVVAIFLLLVAMGLYQPYTTSATVVQQVMPIVPRGEGRMIEVPVEPNAPLKAGDVLFRIDPGPYQTKVDSLEAQLAEATQQAKMLEGDLAAATATVGRRKAQLADARQQVEVLRADLERVTAAVEKARAQAVLGKSAHAAVVRAHERDAMTDIELERADADFASVEAALREAESAELMARLTFESEYEGVSTGVAQAEAQLREAEAAERNAWLALESTINGENTTVARLRADLERARIDLTECTVYAPADGYVTQLFLEPGAVVKTMQIASVMSFVFAGDLSIRGIFPPNALRHMKPGDAAEVALDVLPGRVLDATVVSIVPAMGEGAITPSGSLSTTAEWSSRSAVVVRLQLAEDIEDYQVPVGTGCAAAVYTDRAKPIRIVRMIIIRMGAWMNYL